MTPSDGLRDPFMTEDQVLSLVSRAKLERSSTGKASNRRAAFLYLVAGRDCLLGAHADTVTASSTAIRALQPRVGQTRAAASQTGDRGLPDMANVVQHLKRGPVQIYEVNKRYRYLVGNSVDASTNNGGATGVNGIWASADDYLADLVDVCLGLGAADMDADRTFTLTLVIDLAPSEVVRAVVRGQAAVGALDDWMAAATLLAAWAKTSDYLESRTATWYRALEPFNDVYGLGIERAGRRFRPGVTTSAVTDAVAAVLEGASIRWYADRHSFPGESEQERINSYLEWVIGAVGALLVGYTYEGRAARSIPDALDARAVNARRFP